MILPTFEYPNYVYRAKVVKIVDGDTIDVDLDIGFNTTVRKRLRFYGIDTWETRGVEKAKGNVAKAALALKLSDADDIFVQTVMDATGKYGRVLAWVWTVTDDDVECVNRVMLVEGHGTEYPTP